MEVLGTVKQILNTETLGQAPKQLTLKKIIITTPGQYSSDIAIDFLNKAIDYLSSIKVGDHVEIKVNAKSKEYKGKWYTNLTAYGIALREPEVANADQMPDTNDNADGLPF